MRKSEWLRAASARATWFFMVRGVATGKQGKRQSFTANLLVKDSGKSLTQLTMAEERRNMLCFEGLVSVTAANQEPSTAEIRAQLDRITSTALGRSKSLVRLLQFLVEHSLSGSTEAPKEYLLGVEVFDRGAAFDPAGDNIVRVQVRNLRTRLEDYYAGAGADDPIRFELPKGGYSVAIHYGKTLEVAEIPATAPVGPQRRNWLTAIIIAIAFAGAGVGVWYWFHRTQSPPSVRTHLIAVLPFENLDHNPETDYIADGVAEQTITALSRLEGLEVVGRTSSFSFRRSASTSQQIALQLHATEILEGSVRTGGSRSRITVRLLDGGTGRLLWSSEFDRDTADLLRAEENIASSVSSALRLKLAPNPPAAGERPGPTNNAYDFYLRGRYFWNKSDGADADNAVNAFKQAIAADPTFSPAYVGLAGAYGLKLHTEGMPAREGWGEVESAVRKALALDETNGEAHTMYAGVLAWYRWDYRNSELEYRRGIQLAPGSVISHQYFASFLGAFGRFGEARKEMDLALKLDPVNSLALWGSAQLYYWQGRYPEAIAILEDLRSRQPEFSWIYRLLPVCYLLNGHAERAVQILEVRLREAPSDPEAVAWMSYCKSRSRQQGEARKFDARLKGIVTGHSGTAWDAAIVALGAGKKADAIRNLARAVDERLLRPPQLLVTPIFKELMPETAFRELLVHSNLKAPQVE